jgi:L-iditol 2-dehydrogenase
MDEATRARIAGSYPRRDGGDYASGVRVAMYYGLGKIRLEVAPDPVAGPGEIVVKMTACGICGTDLMGWYQDPRAPLVLGHEPVGVVHEVGEGAPFAIGERVFVHHHVPCFVCDRCRAGRHTLCEQFRRTNIDPGGLAELIRVPAENVRADVLRLPDDVSDWVATLIEPLACVLRGLRQVEVGPGVRVAVVGAGGMGLLEALAALALGASRVVVIEPRADRRAVAQSLGFAVLASSDPDALRREMGGALADVVVVCTHDHGAIAGALALAAHAARVQLFAPTEPGQLVALDLGSSFFREVSIGSTYSAGPFDTREALDLLAAGQIDAGKIVSHRVGFDDVGDAFDLARGGTALKVVVENP